MPIRLTTLRPMRDGAIVACVVLAIAHFTGYVQTGVDAHSYWASNPLDPYGAVRPGQQDAYFYAPVFTQLLGPLHLLPWPAFIGLWTLFLSAALVWQAGLWTGIALLFVPVFADLTVGNIHLLLAAAIVAGFRWPWLWALPLLTKITPGVGLLWFVVRREWLNLAIAWEMLLLLLVVYLPFFQYAVGTFALPLEDWLITAGAAVTICPVLEIAKLLERRGWFGELA